jgi:site-specific DNA-methyltransferase (adenine-specific)
VLVIADGSWVDTSIALRGAGFENRDTILYFDGGLRWVPILVFRKPLSGSSALEQVLATDTGAYNIDRVRIQGVVPAPTTVREYRRFDTKGDLPKLVAPPPPNQLGRWPTNMLIRHTAGCVHRGVKKQHGVEIPVIDCTAECPLPFLERQSKAAGVMGSRVEGGLHADDGAAGRFIPQFMTETELVDWLLRLVSPLGGKVLDPLAPNGLLGSEVVSAV